MDRSLSAGVLFVFTAFAAPILAQEQTKSNALKPLTPEASLSLRSISDLQFSADGNHLAFVVTEPPKRERSARQVWVYEKQSGSIRQFTYSGKFESNPRWSPDGKQLAFLSDRDEQLQVYAIRADGGEASALTKGKRGVKNFAGSPDGKEIAFLAPDAKTEPEEKKEKDKDDAHVVDKEDKHARLRLLTLDSGEAKALTDAKWEISDAVWHPSGTSLVISATDHPESDQNPNRISSAQASDGSIKPLAAPRGPFGELRVSPDGMTISYVGCRDDGPTTHDLITIPAKGGPPRNLTGANLDRPVFQYIWLPDNSIAAVARNRFHTQHVAFSFPRVKRDRNLLNNITNPASIAGSPDRAEFAFAGQTATQPPELWLSDQRGSPKPISTLNDSLKQYSLSVPEFYKYKSFDGLEIEASLLKPPASDSKSKLPLIALIHGGPTGAWQDSIETWGQLLAARRYAVFHPHLPRSSRFRPQFLVK